MFERFTNRARRVLVLAQEEARLLNHNFIGTEHILLGLIHEGEGLAAEALESLGITLQAAREKVEDAVGPAGSSTTGSPPFTPGAKKVLELSLREALQLGHDSIDTEHMLLGLVREGEGVAVQVLLSLGADLSRVRSSVLSLLQKGNLGTPKPHAAAHRQRSIPLRVRTARPSVHDQRRGQLDSPRGPAHRHRGRQRRRSLPQRHLRGNGSGNDRGYAGDC
jgi:ATP-dependent Clp protease ATP-binding subunit ClpC